MDIIKMQLKVTDLMLAELSASWRGPMDDYFDCSV